MTERYRVKGLRPAPTLGLDELMIVNPTGAHGTAVVLTPDGRLLSLRPVGTAAALQPCACGCRDDRPAPPRAAAEPVIPPRVCVVDAAGRIYRPIGKL